MVRIVGTYEQTSTAGETVNVFVPAPLPPSNPSLMMDSELSVLLQRAEAAVARLKFAGTMVPSLDRLLITLLLEHWKVMDTPLLYPSLYFKRHRTEYYRRLNAVRTDGDFESWLKYFLEGVAVIAGETVATTQQLFALTSADRPRFWRTTGYRVMKKTRGIRRFSKA